MIAIYDISTGQLICSVATMIDVAKTLPAGIAIKEVGTILDGYEWNPIKLQFELPPRASLISKDAFIKRFHSDELRALFTVNTNPNLEEEQKGYINFFTKCLEFYSDIDLDSAAIRDGVRYLERAGIIGINRSKEILGG